MAKRRAFDRLKQADEEVKLPPPASEAKRSRDWEKTHPVTAYRGIPAELQAEIKEIADDLGVPAGDVARAFLVHGLKAYRAGTLKLAPGRSAGKWTLFPEWV